MCDEGERAREKGPETYIPNEWALQTRPALGDAQGEPGARHVVFEVALGVEQGKPTPREAVKNLSGHERASEGGFDVKR